MYAVDARGRTALHCAVSSISTAFFFVSTFCAAAAAVGVSSILFLLLYAMLLLLLFLLLFLPPLLLLDLISVAILLFQARAGALCLCEFLVRMGGGDLVAMTDAAGVDAVGEARERCREKATIDFLRKSMPKKAREAKELKKKEDQTEAKVKEEEEEEEEKGEGEK